MPVDPRERYVERLEVYRDRLLQLDWRNRSILLGRVNKRWAFDLGSLWPLQQSVVEEVLRRAVGGKGRARILLDSDTSKEGTEMRANLTQVARWDLRVFEESGLRDLYLGFPFLEGRADAERYVRAPLVLFPARLEHLRRDRGAGWYVTFSPEDPTTLNRALLAALKRVCGISLPGDFQEKLEEVLETAAMERVDVVGSFLHLLAQALADAGFPLKSTKVDLSEVPQALPLAAEDLNWGKPRALHIEPLAVLGSFPQASTAIYQDYEGLVQEARSGQGDVGVVADLLEGPSPPARTPSPRVTHDLDAIPDRDLNFALPTDGSQEAVIAEAQREPCVVVRGPPGTGKSQVIVNLITNALAKGERVLVVCQKRAALDIVHQRLGRVGLSDHVVLLHDARADRPEVYAGLVRRLQAPSPPADPRLDRDFLATSRQIDETIAELNALVQPLWREYFGGVRLQELYAEADPEYRPRRDLVLPTEDLTLHSLETLVDNMPRLEEGYRKFKLHDSPLAGRRSFADLGAAAKYEIDDALTLVEKGIVPGALCLPGTRQQHTALARVYRYRARMRGGARHLDPRWWVASRTVRSLFKGSGKPTLSDLEDLEGSLQAGLRLMDAVDHLGVWFQPPALIDLRRRLVDQDALRRRVGAMQSALGEYDSLQEYDRAVASLDPFQASTFDAVARVLFKEPGPWARVLRQEVFARWIEAIETRERQLTGDPFPRYIALRRRLAGLLEERRRLFVRRLALQLDSALRGASGAAEGAPKAAAGDEASNELNKLIYEFNRRRHIKPVRRLLEEFPSIFLRIAPCWLVSPEAASEVFPLQRGLFDLVVFDESSQLAVERALPAIYRGKRVFIAGDEKQLRPFDLFQLREAEDEGSEDEVTEAESLLVLAMRSFTPRYLSWHYRSKFQELIDFSNHVFYDGNLQIAANVQRTMEEPPIEFVRCRGTWEGRHNPQEAERVVELIASLLERNEKLGQDLSLGVVSFNDPQRDLIMDTIEARRTADAEFDRLYSKADHPDRPIDDRPFIKNIENVQGDERDVIIFSVGYAPDSTGKLRVQFGPLNVEGGENRLNVAITRARQRVILVASFDPQSLPVEDTKNPGPKRLKDYLLYAQAVSGMHREEIVALLTRLNRALATERTATAPLGEENPLEAQVREALMGLGYEVDSRVGFSGYRIDLAVVHPSDPKRYILGIECDGPTFHSASSARERDVTRQRYLEERGWTLERIWSRSWWRNRQGEINRLRARIQELSQTKKAS